MNHLPNNIQGTEETITPVPDFVRGVVSVAGTLLEVVTPFSAMLYGQSSGDALQTVNAGIQGSYVMSEKMIVWSVCLTAYPAA